MDGRRTVATTQDAAYRDHHNIHQEMFPIPRMPRVGKRLKVRTNCFNVHQFRCHASHPGMRQAGSSSDLRSRQCASTADTKMYHFSIDRASLCRLPTYARALPDLLIFNRPIAFGESMPPFQLQSSSSSSNVRSETTTTTPTTPPDRQVYKYTSTKSRPVKPPKPGR